MRVAGDEPVHHRERRSGAAGSKGIEGERSLPSPASMFNIEYAGS